MYNKNANNIIIILSDLNSFYKLTIQNKKKSIQNLNYIIGNNA